MPECVRLQNFSYSELKISSEVEKTIFSMTNFDFWIEISWTEANLKSPFIGFSNYRAHRTFIVYFYKIYFSKWNRIIFTENAINNFIEKKLLKGNTCHDLVLKWRGFCYSPFTRRCRYVHSPDASIKTRIALHVSRVFSSRWVRAIFGNGFLQSSIKLSHLKLYIYIYIHYSIEPNLDNASVVYAVI